MFFLFFSYCGPEARNLFCSWSTGSQHLVSKLGRDKAMSHMSNITAAAVGGLVFKCPKCKIELVPLAKARC